MATTTATDKVKETYKVTFQHVLPASITTSSKSFYNEIHEKEVTLESRKRDTKKLRQEKAAKIVKANEERYGFNRTIKILGVIKTATVK